jgi:hypothetical protein
MVYGISCNTRAKGGLAGLQGSGGSGLGSRSISGRTLPGAVSRVNTMGSGFPGEIPEVVMGIRREGKLYGLMLTFR